MKVKKTRITLTHDGKVWTTNVFDSIDHYLETKKKNPDTRIILIRNKVTGSAHLKHATLREVKLTYQQVGTENLRH